MRAGLVAMALVMVAVGCSGDDDSPPESATASTGPGVVTTASGVEQPGEQSDDPSDQPSTTGEASDVTSEPVDPDDPSSIEAPADEDPAPDTSDPGLDAEIERAAFEGITFEYPTPLFTSAREADTAGSSPANAVEIELRPVEGGPTAGIRVLTVRNARGRLLGDLSERDREVVEAVAADRPLDDGEIELGFVNGAGRRTADESGYAFTGLTGDGAQLVEVTLAASASNRTVVRALDRVVESLFVDGGAAVLSVDGCERAVDVIGEVVLAERSVEPGAAVTASWRVLNSGSCPWTSADSWVFTGGDPVTIVEVPDVAGVAPGDEADVTVTLRAPETPGLYTTQWQFLPGGEFDAIGPVMPVAFEVR